MSNAPVHDEQAPAVKAAPTAYVLLSQDGDTWKVAARNVTARSSEQAVRQYAERADTPTDKPLVLVALPSRSWRPVRISAQVKTTLAIEEVKG